VEDIAAGNFDDNEIVKITGQKVTREQVED
jgi:hypothetical protein